MGADRSQWQFPRNEADKVIGWRPNGKGMENKSPADLGTAMGAVLKTDTSTASMSFVGTGSDLSTDPDKLAKRGDVADYAARKTEFDIREFAEGVGLEDATADTDAWIAALAYIGTNGGVLLLPNASLRIETGGVCDITADDTVIRSEKRVSIRGVGRGPSVVEWRGTGTDPLLKVTGSANDGGVDFQLENIKFAGFDRDVDGLDLNSLAFFAVKDVFVLGFANGIKMRDVISGRFDGSVLTSNIRGMDAGTTGTFRPNALSFFQTVVGSNLEYGMYFDQPTQLDFYGGSFEGNGTDSTNYTDRGGIYINSPCAAGGIAANFWGVYFEGNRGLADIILDMGGNAATLGTYGCNFNRIDSTNFVTNDILIKHDVADGAVGLVAVGNSFRKFNTYSADSSRKYWAFSGTGTNRSVSDIGNHFDDATESPSGSTTLGANFTGTVPAIRLTDVNGGYHEIQGNVGVLDIRCDHGDEVANSVLNIKVDGSTAATFGAGGTVILSNLPTSDPGVTGRLWNDTGTLKVS